MSNDQLVPAEKKPLAIIKKAPKQKPSPLVAYSMIDPLHYSFTCELDETIFLRMDESENAHKRSEFAEAEFEDNVPEHHRVYYAVAAASGGLTGALSFVKLTEEQLADIEAWKKKDWERIVIYAAELIGCKKKDYKSACKYLVNQAIQRVKEDEAAKEYMTILAAHPTLAGLLFSLISQFAEKAISLDESGNIKCKDLPKYYYVGHTNAEKIMSAVLYWLFNLAANQASSKRHILDELGVPAELLKKIKTFVNIPFLQKIPDNYEQAEREYSDWIRGMLENTILFTELGDGDDQNAELGKRLIHMALNISEDAFPVLINECIVRCLYILIRICDVAGTNQIKTFSELKAIPATEILPQENRILTRMCLIASASFVGVNISVAALKALASAKAKDRKFLENFLTEINIVGVGRLVFACAADSKFWGDDIKMQFQRKPCSHVDQEDEREHVEFNDVFSTLSLTPNQTFLLLALEYRAVQQDIARTKKIDDAEKKQLWLNIWRESLAVGLGMTPEIESACFETDEDVLYDGIYQISKDKTNYGWFYRLAQELVLFVPYAKLNCENDTEFKKLKLEYNYITDQFVRRQTIVSQLEVEQILKTYKKYTNYVSGKTEKRIKSIATGAAVTVASGGLCLAYAPGIAVVIAGKAVAGLHGAVLIKASLALVGGGSLAAGGLGMAGGTAIITSGGALLGLLGSGSVSAAAYLMGASDEDVIEECAKLLTYSKCVMAEKLEDKEALQTLADHIEEVAKHTKEECEAVKEEKNTLDKKYIKNLDRASDYLDKVHRELQKINKRQ